MSILTTAYETVTQAAKADLKGDPVSKALAELIGLSLKFLIDNCKRVPLTSNVPGKTYFTFQAKGDVGSGKSGPGFPEILAPS